MKLFVTIAMAVMGIAAADVSDRTYLPPYSGASTTNYETNIDLPAGSFSEKATYSAPTNTFSIYLPPAAAHTYFAAPSFTQSTYSASPSIARPTYTADRTHFQSTYSAGPSFSSSSHSAPAASITYSAPSYSSNSQYGTQYRSYGGYVIQRK